MGTDPMTDISLEQRARELLAAEFRRLGERNDSAELIADAETIEDGEEWDFWMDAAHAAVVAAPRLSAGADGMVLRHASVLLGIIDGADKHRDGYLWWPKGRSIDEQNWYAEQGIAQRAQIEEARAAIAIATATTEVCHE